MKHTEETKKRISETLKRRGIKPTVLPSKEQCIKNLGIHLMEKGDTPWNKGGVGLQVAWNKGIEMPQSTKDKLRETFFKKNNIPWNKKGHKECMDCGTELARRKANRCVKCNGLNNRGENHYNWKGGTGNPLRILRSSYEYKKWRSEVFKRDYWTCQICDIKGKKIWADHIKPFALFPESRFDVNNGRTVCVDCALKLPTHGNRVWQTTPAKGLTIRLGIREN